VAPASMGRISYFIFFSREIIYSIDTAVCSANLPLNAELSLNPPLISVRLVTAFFRARRKFVTDFRAVQILPLAITQWNLATERIWATNKQNHQVSLFDSIVAVLTNN